MLRRSARKSRMERIKNEYIYIYIYIYKGNNGSEREAGELIYYTTEKTTMVWPRQTDARGDNAKFNYGLDTTGEEEKRTPKKNVDRRSTSSHYKKKFRTRSMEKQRGVAFGFRKTATAVKKPDREVDRSVQFFLIQTQQ